MGLDIIVLALFFNLLQIFVGAFPGTPLNDDWAYTRILEEFVRTGRFVPLNWIAMNQVTQTVMAYPFVRVFGGGWSVLHVFTMIMGTGVLALTVVWMRQLGASRGVAFAVALAWMANPIFVGLSGSFMTDVPFLVLLLLSFVLATRFLQQEQNAFGTLVLFVLCIVAAMLLRQPALWLALAFAAACFDKKKGWRNVRSWIPFFCAVVAQILFDYWLSQRGANPQMKRLLTARVIEYATGLLRGEGWLWNLLLQNITDFPSYVAILMIPLLPLWLCEVKEHWVGTEPVQRRVMAAAFAAGCLVVGLAGMPPFRSDNVIGSLGLGPFTLRDGIILKSSLLASVPVAFWVGIWCLTAVTGGTMLAAWAGYVHREKAWKQPVIRLLIVFMVLYSAPFIMTDFIDRYVLPVLACASAVLPLLRQKNRTLPVLVWIWLAVWVAVAAIAAHDYQAWQHARWKAGRDLLEQGIGPNRIDGGFEFNGYYLYDRVDPTPGKSWWWVVDDEYLIAFSSEPFPDYQDLKEYRVGGWLPTTPKLVHVLHRKGPT